MATLQELVSLGLVNGWPNGSRISYDSVRQYQVYGLIGKNLTTTPSGLLQLTHMTALGLHENELSSLPAGIGQLANLQMLNLSKNKLSFVPDSITKLTALTLLSLHTNELSSLPAGIGHLVNLQSLSLNINKLSSVPDSITKLTRLTLLNLYENELSSLPAGIGQLVNLKSLSLNTNKLSFVPDSITKLTGLTYLNLHTNELSSLPAEIGQLVNLQTLGLSTNKLSSVPGLITKLTGLTLLGLDTNELSSLPAGIGQLVNLQMLELSKNKLSSVPDSITNLTGLTFLNLHTNELSSVPAGIGLLVKLKQQLDLSSNKLSSVPDSITKLTGLTAIRLHNNELPYVPAGIRLLGNLSELSLATNKITTVADSIAKMTGLTSLSLHSNLISSLPSGFGLLVNMRSIDLSANELSFVPENIGNLTNLTRLILSQNPIIEIPDSITRLRSLRDIVIEWQGAISILYAPFEITALPCWKNDERPNDWGENLTMTICEALKKLKLSIKCTNEYLVDIGSLFENWTMCHFVDISHNQISVIPDQFIILTDLCELNISNNRFNSFPDVLLRMNWLTSLNISGNLFTELPEGITNLENLENLVITDDFGKVIIQRATQKISTLPCYDANHDLRALKWLHDFSNEEIYDITEFIEKWESLTTLILSQNQINSLPDQLSTLTRLCELNLATNQLQKFPEVLVKMSWLHSLDISDNWFTELPDGITQLVNLSHFLIEDKAGKITIQRAPIGISNLPCFNLNPSLRLLRIYSTHENKGLSDIDQHIDAWTDCTDISLANNQISFLPEDMTVLTALQALDISYNQFFTFPEVLLEMNWLTCLNISGNSITELPEGITKLANLSKLVLADDTGRLSIQRAPIGISSLPCFRSNIDIRILEFYLPIGSPPASLPILQRIDAEKHRIPQDVFEDASSTTSTPVLVLSHAKVNEVSATACKNGTLCLLCLKTLTDPCTLECGHIFCGACVIDAIQESIMQVPFACPTCRKPSITSEYISEGMKIAPRFIELDAGGTVEEALNPDASTTKCKNRSCKEKATHNCVYCGNFCQKHLESHNDVHDDHAELISAIIPGAVPTHTKFVCPIHHAMEVKYYCAECTEKSFKCSECAIEDHQTHEQGMHETIQCGSSGSAKFKEILEAEIMKLDDKIERLNASLNKIDEERRKFSQSLDEKKEEARQFIESLQKLVDQLKKNIDGQLDNIEKEFKRELDSRDYELKADAERIKLSKQLISDAIENHGMIKPAELNNIMRFYREITAQPAKEIRLQTMMMTERLPRQLLYQLESLNRQLLFGMAPEASTSQTSSPDVIISLDDLQSFVFDQESQQYFGVCKQTSEIIVVSKQQKVIRQMPAHFLIECNPRRLQGISVSRMSILAVADELANIVTLYDTKTISVGLVLRDFGEGRDCLFNAPSDVAFDSHGRLFVVDSRSKSVIVFDENFDFLSRIDIANVGSTRVERTPRMIEISTGDSIFVYCTDIDSILEFDKGFNLIQEDILPPALESPEFEYP